VVIKKNTIGGGPLPLPQKVALLFLSLFFYLSFPFSMGSMTKNPTIVGGNSSQPPSSSLEVQHFQTFFFIATN
jgi:hypothetical protein